MSSTNRTENSTAGCFQALLQALMFGMIFGVLTFSITTLHDLDRIHAIVKEEQRVRIEKEELDRQHQPDPKKGRLPFPGF